jgi:hypothetical protein
LAIKPQHWRPPFVCWREHSQNVTQEETWKGASDRRLISCGRSSGPQNNPSNHPTTNIHRPWHSNQPNFKRQKLKKINNKTQKKRLKQSSKMNWYALARRMSICDLCKSRWPEERQWPKEPRSCSKRLNKKEQLRRSCSKR